ncbi:hypothetical protein DS901_02135 [Loktanella sp. D2R18]|uniref:hypothetical protein n=1 Tax=Rhodobacterales TaxID=204455 RepID=UPI000DEA0337|nr:MULTISPECIES: hypothetical protein [Rhodobacterales]MDO6589909.1 hypothetical protein [Yoonia sp. 1_MG-2023]RBW45942.1 hypothetical protein DS901_02135 [Loktanella sp. D2R18]
MKLITALIFAASTSPAFAIDPCLVGVWQADNDDLAHVMGSQMPAGGSIGYVSGTVTLEITGDGTMTLLSNNFRVNSMMPDIPPTTVTINGWSEGAMNADDGSTYVANAPDYDLIGTADVMGAIIEISAAELSGGVWGQSTGTYGCTGDSVSFEAERLGSIPRLWRRAG